MRTLGADRAAGPNPLAARVRRARCAVDSPHTATVQEVHLVAVHLLCAAVDGAPWRELGARAVASMRASVVVGDALLDRDLDGRAERLAPDAPGAGRRRGSRSARGPAARGWPPRSPRPPAHAVTLVCALGDDAAGRARARAARARRASRCCDLGLRGRDARRRSASAPAAARSCGSTPAARRAAAGRSTPRRAPRSPPPTPCSSPTTAAASPPRRRVRAALAGLPRDPARLGSAPARTRARAGLHCS